MKQKNIFKGLNLDRDKLPEWIQEFAESKFSSFEISDIHFIGGTQYRCTINADLKEILVDFYYAQDGKTTIRPVGQHMDLSTQIASHIRGKQQFNATDRSGNYSVAPLEKDEVDLLVEYLVTELEGVKKINESYNETQKYTLYQFQSKIADKITLKYYETTRRLQVQGKPMYLYQEVTCFLSAYFPFDEVVKNQSEFFNVEIRPEEIRDEMQELLPSTYNYLDENLKKILSGSLALQKIDIPLEDFSPFVFPALKTLEGFIKKVLHSNGITITKKDNIGGLFGYNETKRTHVYLSKKGTELKDEVTKSWVETLYNYYHKQRHSLFHVETFDAFTRVIESKEEADLIIAKVLDLMEHAHKEMSEATVS